MKAPARTELKLPQEEPGHQVGLLLLEAFSRSEARAWVYLGAYAKLGAFVDVLLTQFDELDLVIEPLGRDQSEFVVRDLLRLNRHRGHPPDFEMARKRANHLVDELLSVPGQSPKQVRTDLATYVRRGIVARALTAQSPRVLVSRGCLENTVRECGWILDSRLPSP